MWFFILVVIALLIYLFSERSHMKRELERLRDELNELRADVHVLFYEPKVDAPPAQVTPPPVVSVPPPVTRPEPSVPAPQVQAPAPVPSHTPEEPPAPVEPPVQVTPPLIPPVAVPPPPGVATPAYSVPTPPPVVPPVEASVAAAPAAASAHARTRGEWEMLIGGKLFNWLAAIALIIGMGLLFKLAIDNGWISEELRVLAGLLLGAGLLWAGDHFARRGLSLFTQGLVGAGVSILYLTVYAAYGFYHLPYVPTPVALVLLSAVTAVAIWQSLKYDALAIALLGLIGGFLTPLVLHSDPAASRGIGLFTYLLFLNAGLLAVQLRKDHWILLEPLAMLGTTLLVGAWLVDHAPLASTWPVNFVFMLWVLFHSLHLVRAALRMQHQAGLRAVLFAVNALLVWVGSYAMLHHFGDAPIFLVSLLLTAAYLGSALALRARRPESTLAITLHDLAAVVFLTAAWPFEFPHYSLVMVYAAQATLIVGIGLLARHRYLWGTGLGIFSLAFVLLLFTPGAFAALSIVNYTPLANLRAFAFAALVAGLLFSALLFQRMGKDTEREIAGTLHYLWSALLFTLLTVETHDYFRHALASGANAKAPFIHNRYLMMAVVWMLYSLPLLWIGLRKRTTALVNIGLCSVLVAAAMLAVRGTIYEPIEAFLPVLNLRAIPVLLAIGALALQAHWLARRQTALTGNVINLLHLVIGVLLFELVTVEVNDLFRHYLLTASTAVWLQYARFTALPVGWTAYALLLTWYTRRRQSAPLYYCALIAQAAAVLTLAFASFVQPPVAGYLPLLNARAIPALLVVAGLLLLQRLLRPQYADHPALAALEPALPVITAICGFQLVSMELLGDIYYYAASEGILAATLPMLWTLYALGIAWNALRRRLPALLVTSLLMLTGAVIMLALGNTAYQPLESFIPVVNARALAFLFVIGGVSAFAMLCRRHQDDYPWLGECRGMLYTVNAILLFEVITVEVSDYFRGQAGLAGIDAHFARQLMWAVAWMVYALPVTWIGLQRRLAGVCWCGLGALGLGALWIAALGMRFQPVEAFAPVMNMRAVSFLLVIAALTFAVRLFDRHREVLPWLPRLATAGRIVIAVLVFELLTVETLDFFAAATEGGMQLTDPRYFNLLQMSLSVVWLVYSLGLLGYGLWQKLPVQRVMAMVLMLVTIGKIFLVDLSFLETIYRVASFIVLGLILFGASYLYQRYRGIILGSEAPASAPGPVDAK